MDWKDTPPREKVWASPENVHFEELLAVLLSQGFRGRNVMELAGEVARMAGDPRGLLQLSPGALMRIKGIGHARAAMLTAVVEIARRQNSGSLPPGRKLQSRELASWLLHRLQGREQEFFYLFAFNRRFELLRHHQVARGTADQVQVYFRDLVQLLLNDRASFAIIAHNHPESLAFPSQLDLVHMRKLERLLENLGIRLLDQLIAGEGGVYSCRRGRFVLPAHPGAVRQPSRHSRILASIDRKIQYANPEPRDELESGVGGAPSAERI